MKLVKVEILPAHDGEVVTATITEETKRGGSWEEGSKNTVLSGTPQASRSMMLDDDDRVIIEGKVEAEVVLDNDQRAAKKEFRGEKRKEEEKKDKEQQEKFEKMNKEAKERLEKEKPEEAKLREEQEKARDEKIMGKQEQKSEDDKEEKKKSQKDTEAPSTGGGRDAGLRHGIPVDSKEVADPGSTTKKK